MSYIIRFSLIIKFTPNNVDRSQILKEKLMTTVETTFFDDEIIQLTKILCIIHRKSDQNELDEFFSEYLFRLVPVSRSLTSRNGQNHPIIDDKTHRLERGSILDLFIRQTIADRSTITSKGPTKRMRLVEPIIRADEFDSWYFDHFHDLMNFWLVNDEQCQTTLPPRWTLTHDAQIEYLITKKFLTEEQHSKQPTSQSEIRANLHMIKLFINRSLEEKNDIEVLPLLDAFCVEQAFKEMADDGFEDEDLFPQLNSFFKPLTVASRDLFVNREEQEEKDVEFELRSLTAEYQTTCAMFLHVENEIDQLNKEKTAIQNDLLKQKNEQKLNETEMRNLDLKWVKNNLKLVEQIEQGIQYQKDLQQKFVEIENQRKTVELRLVEIKENLSKNERRMDQQWVKSHRGIILYGPSGTKNNLFTLIVES